jgi:hypothetical protein
MPVLRLFMFALLSLTPVALLPSRFTDDWMHKFFFFFFISSLVVSFSKLSGSFEISFCPLSLSVAILLILFSFAVELRF